MFNLHKRCETEMAYLRELVRSLQERNDRLTEALTWKVGLNLDLPRPDPPEFTPPIINGVAMEFKQPVGEWWKMMSNTPKVATVPPPEGGKK